MLEPCLVMRGDSLQRLVLSFSILILDLTSILRIDLSNCSTQLPGTGGCGALNLIARGLVDDEPPSRKAM
jgi:hypothetical protein